MKDKRDGNSRVINKEVLVMNFETTTKALTEDDSPQIPMFSSV